MGTWIVPLRIMETGVWDWKRTVSVEVKNESSGI
jgi:hypothetical protein